MSDAVIKNWTENLANAHRELRLVYQQLPEVQLSNPNLSPVEFGKQLIEKPGNPVWLDNQTDFLEPEQLGESDAGH